MKIIEQNHSGHFLCLPTILGFPVCDQHEVKVINCGLNTSMFNIVFGAPLQTENSFDVIADIKAVFKGQPFAWWVPPSDYTGSLSALLEEAGMIMETREHAMICDLAIVTPESLQTPLIVRKVVTRLQLQDFISILEPYDPMARTFYEKLTEAMLHTAAENLFVGYLNNIPVVIGVLFNDIQASGVFSLLTDESARGKGYGTDMMSYLLGVAKNQGQHYVTLSASSDSGYRIYERLGFKRVGEFACFEHKG